MENKKNTVVFIDGTSNAGKPGSPKSTNIHKSRSHRVRAVNLAARSSAGTRRIAEVNGSGPRTCAAVLAAMALLASCTPKESADGIGPVLTEPEPAIPAGYKKIAPTALDTSAQMLAQTATVFQGTLKHVEFTYDGCAGPRTHYVFSDATTLMGTPIQGQVTLKVLGGPTPYGTWIRVSELPKLALDSEYVVFLRNTDWTLSPVVASLVFRRETVDGRELLIDPSGYAVTGWNENGPTISSARVSDPVGHQLRRYRNAEPLAPPLPASSGATPDPAAEVRPASGDAPSAAQPGSAGSTLERAPSAAEIRTARMFARPALSVAATDALRALTTESLVSTIKDAALRGGVEIGGRATLEPYWKCWSSTPTARAER